MAQDPARVDITFPMTQPLYIVVYKGVERDCLTLISCKFLEAMIVDRGELDEMADKLDWRVYKETGAQESGYRMNITRHLPPVFLCGA